jgi:hypothetical protein
MEHPLDCLNPDEQPTSSCNYCGVPCEGSYCSKNCAVADIYD